MRTMIRDIKFDDRGLIPAIVQNRRDHRVLALAYMNAESLALTLRTGEVRFADSGGGDVDPPPFGTRHRVVNIALDTAGNALIVSVETTETEADHAAPIPAESFSTAGKSGVSVPGVEVVDVGAMELGILLEQLYRLVLDRKKMRPEGAYTTFLFNAGLDRILKKIGEEAVETVIAAKNGSRKELATEIADLFYHLLVLTAERDIPLREILAELNARAGIGQSH